MSSGRPADRGPWVLQAQEGLGILFEVTGDTARGPYLT